MGTFGESAMTGGLRAIDRLRAVNKLRAVDKLRAGHNKLNAAHKLAFVVPLLLLAACSSGGRHYQGFQETLSIEILPNTSKLFVYRLRMPEEMRRPLVQVYDSAKEASQHRRRDPLGESAYRQLRRDTERAVALTDYCRDGILELDYRLSYEEMWMRGECKEGATEKDQNRFAGRDELPVPQDQD